MPKQTVAVLFGGASSEHEVSLVSAQSVIENIPKETFELLLVGITKEGRWFLYGGPTEALPDGSWERDPGNLPACIVPDSSVHGLAVTQRDGSVRTRRVDICFPVLHGANGEDGTVQGLLQLAGIPFVGCGCASSALCMDKMFQKCVAASAGIPQAKWEYALVAEYRKNPEAVLSRAERLGYPIFVKPANAGSSVGISKAHSRAELTRAVEAAAKHDPKILFEEAVEGREVECAVLGNSEPVASSPGEILPCNEFYDYDAKYLAGKTGLRIPAQLPADVTERVRETAVKAYVLFGCRGMARMDFFVRKSDGAVLLNEPNTIPGFTSISMYPKLFAASGVPYGELLGRLLRLALEP